MTAPASSPLPSERTPGVASAQTVQGRIPAAEIDASCRGPVLFLFLCGMIWLVLGLVLAVISSIKLHGPGFLAGTPWLTLGRVRPAAMNAILYGFASQTALGVLLWLLCRLGGVRLLFQNTIAIATAFWNLGVTLGILGILAGGSTGFAWLEMPRAVPPILFVSYALIGICAMAGFYLRRERSLYVSQWYLLAGLFWFPWLYSAASLLLLYFPVRGVVQSVVDAWFTGNFLALWLGPVCLGAIFYFIPKLSGRPLYSQSLAAFGFWTLLFFGNWTGLTQLVGGPVPAWMASAGIVGNVLLLVPLICLGLNWHMTLKGDYAKTKTDSTLRYVVFGAASYVVGSLLSILLGLREVSAFTHLTYAEAGQAQLALLGFVAMTLLGSVHYIVPRLVRAAWPSAKRMQVHFWCSAIGIALVVAALGLGGLVQAFGLKDPALPFVKVVKSTIPFIGLVTLGQLLLLVGQTALLWNLVLVVRAQFEPLRQSALALVVGGDSTPKEVRS